MSQIDQSILLLTNDDGVEAPGLAALQEATKTLGSCRVVAPLGHYSGCGHAVTITGPITIKTLLDGRIGVGGSPADCVRLALKRVAPEFSCVISGINAGGNLGSDIHHSGTVAAVREAVLRGRPGIAISHYITRGRPVDWTRAASRASRVIRDLLEMSWEPGTFWNVNLPHPVPDADEPEVVFCEVDPSPLPLDFRFDEGGETAQYCGDYQSRLRIPKHDVETCFGGKISVSLVRVF